MTGSRDALDVDSEVYRFVLATGRIPGPVDLTGPGVPAERIDEACRMLADLRLIARCDGPDDRWRASSPDDAMLDVVLPIESAARRQAADAARLRARIQSLEPVYVDHRKIADPAAFQVVVEHRQLAEVLRAELAATTSEVLAFSALGQGTPDWFTTELGLHVGAADRGVRLRAIYPHTARSNDVLVSALETLAEHGATFRTIGEVLGPSIIFDRNTCVITVRRGDVQGKRASVTLVIRHSAVADYFAELFNAAWDRAVRYEPDQQQTAEILDETKDAVLRLMATGAKDETIARRLGMSVRSCRRHIAEVMQALGAGSRFQAGVEAERRGLLAAGGLNGDAEDGPSSPASVSLNGKERTHA